MFFMHFQSLLTALCNIFTALGLVAAVLCCIVVLFYFFKFCLKHSLLAAAVTCAHQGKKITFLLLLQIVLHWVPSNTAASKPATLVAKTLWGQSETNAYF